MDDSVLSAIANSSVGVSLCLHDLLSFALSCSTAFKFICPLIESRFYYYYYKGKEPTYFHPKKVLVKDKINSYPSYISEISFADNFIGSVINLPNNITHLTFGRNFNINKFQNKRISQLPPSLSHLSFGHCFNCPVNHCLPDSLRYLSFGKYFNQSVDHLPSSLLSLSLGSKFAQNINTLPSSLLYLKYNFEGNPLYKFISIKSFPPSLSHLDLSSRKFELLSLPSLPASIVYLCAHSPSLFSSLGLLPNLTTLSFFTFENDDFINFPSLSKLSIHTSKPLSSFPVSLSRLSLGYYFNFEISSIPPLLTHLTLVETFIDWKILPQTLVTLQYAARVLPQTPLRIQYQSYDVSNLPPKLSQLTLGYIHKNPLNTAITVPITHLTFGQFFNSTVYLSSCITLSHLTFGLLFNQPVDDKLPLSLSHLSFGPSFNQCLDLSNFSSLIHLLFMKQPKDGYFQGFNQSISLLPNSLLYLTLGDSFTQNITKLPPNLISLKIGFSFSHPLPPLPAGLKYLSLGSMYRNCLNKLLPSSLIKLSVSNPAKNCIKNPTRQRYICNLHKWETDHE